MIFICLNLDSKGITGFHDSKIRESRKLDESRFGDIAEYR